MGTGREQYQRQLEQLRTANVELETSRDDYRLKVDELNSELMELRKKVNVTNAAYYKPLCCTCVYGDKIHMMSGHHHMIQCNRLHNISVSCVMTVRKYLDTHPHSILCISLSLSICCYTIIPYNYCNNYILVNRS